jgi:lantibiotic modifying enzyme
MSWWPLLNGQLKDQAHAGVRAIVEDLAAYWRDPAGEPSLADGHAGWAILCAALAQSDHGNRHLRIAQGCLERAIAATQEKPSTAALYGGLTGLGWAVARLRDSLPDLDQEEILAEIDDVLLGHLEQTPWTSDYDLISGLVGYAVYALKRLPSPSGAACLERIIDHLEHTAEHRPDGITWWTNPKWLLPETREKYPRGYYNLGLAHGVPGVIAVLGRVCTAGIAVDRARPLLDGAVSWLLAHQNHDGFANWVASDLPHSPARLAWCYGDPGVAAALLWAARAVNELAWEREALAIAIRAARRPADRSGVKDAGLCHGAAGLGHIFNRMYQAIGDSRLATAARAWLERTLAMRRPGQGIGGFATWMPRDNGSSEWVADPGLLTGAAGIALALLAATTPVEPAWDAMLLVAIPPARRHFEIPGISLKLADPCGFRP